MPTDPLHGRFIPDGSRDLAVVVRRVLRRMRPVLMDAASKGNNFHFGPWQGLLYHHVRRIILSHYELGIRNAERELRLLVPARVEKGVGIDLGRWVNKLGASAHVTPYRVAAPEGQSRAAAWSESAMPFDVFNVEVLQAVEIRAMKFAASTISMVRESVYDVYSDVRDDIAQGLMEGEPSAAIAKRVSKILTNPVRAAMIAHNEASGAMHAGQMAAWRKSGVVAGTAWLCSADACEKCLELDGEFREFGVPYSTTASKNPDYATVYHPTLHPWCYCTVEPVLM